LVSKAVILTEKETFVMQKFCTKCGGKLDENTGKCPNCDQETVDTSQSFFKKPDSASDINVVPEQAKKSPIVDPIQETNKKAAKKAAKKAKLASMSTGKKVKRWLLRATALLLSAVILVTSVLGTLVYFDILNIPFMLNAMHKMGIQTYHATHEKEIEKNLPETDESGFTYYNSSEDNFVTEEGVKFVNNELLVYLESASYKEDLEDFLLDYDGKIVGELPELARYQILFDDELSYDELMDIIDELEYEDWVDSASLNYVVRFDVSSSEYYPDDALWKGYWDTQIPEDGNWGMEAIDAPGAWHYRNKLGEINVGIFDDMFYTNHPDLNFAEEPLGNKRALNMIENGQLTWSDHGTHTSGTAAASFDNGRGVTGVAINTNIYGASFKGLSDTSNDFETALYYLIVEKNCSVINMSIGNNEVTFNASRKNAFALKELDAFQKEASVFLEKLIDNDYQFVICKSAGNQNSVGDCIYFLKDSYDDDEEYMYYTYDTYEKYKDGSLEDEEDADEIRDYFDRHKKDLKKKMDSGNVDAKYDILGAIKSSKARSRIVMVGAAKNKGTHKEGGFLWFGRKTVHSGYDVADFSQCGKSVDIIAPGVGIQSTVKDNFYSAPDWNGTSMAAPHATGVAGLIFAANPELTGDKVRKIIMDSATGSYSDYHYGLLNAKNAVEMALEYEDEDDENYEDEDEDKDDSKKSKKGGKSMRATSDEREIVLVLDTSGSMMGTPIAETRKACEKFISTALKEDACIGIVTYDNSAKRFADFSVNETYLQDIVSSLGAGGGTNIEDGLVKAREMLAGSNAKKKIIVLMSDGEPNNGKVGEDLISYANEIKQEGTIIYTLGFFGSLGMGKSSAQYLMEKIASDACHYEVASADDLKFFFGDIADQINGTNFIYIRIACPVDVSVSYGGEKLASSGEDANTRTSFGSLTFEESEEQNENSTDNRVKILRLREGVDYDIKIRGNGTGKMDYTIGFMDENGDYSDLREFNNVKIKKRTKIDTVATVADKTVMKVDTDGDGEYDITYEAHPNGKGKKVDNSYIYRIIYISICALAGIILLIVILIFIKKYKKRPKTESASKPVKDTEKKELKKKYCLHCGSAMPEDKKFCTNCGKPLS